MGGLLNETRSFPQLSLDLPGSRMSVDFASLALNLTVDSSHHANRQTAKQRPSRPQVNRLQEYSYGSLLSDVLEEPGVIPLPVTRQKSFRWLWKGSKLDGTAQDDSMKPLSRTASTSSAVSTTSSSSSSDRSVFSATSASTGRSSYAGSYLDLVYGTVTKEVACLTSLPHSILEHILSYALSLPHSVSVGPEIENRHLHYRYHRPGQDYIHLRQIIEHPLLTVSHHIRDVALDVVRTKCEFVIDLQSIYYTKVSSTVRTNIRKHQKFWISQTPDTVKETLQSLSRVQIRLPVPSTESAGHRGRGEDDWMDGSDGNGGGSWKVKSMEKEQEDALEIQKCLDSIVKMIMANKRPTVGGRSSKSSLSRSSSLRRAASTFSDKRRGSQDPLLQGADAQVDETRTPLKRMEIVFVKRSPWALVLSETVSLVKALRSMPVTGFTRYFFELNGQKLIWATKQRKRWQGFEPDARRLLQDLQALTIEEKPIEPIQTPKTFRHVSVTKQGHLQLLDGAFPKTPITLEPMGQPPMRLGPVPPRVPAKSKGPRVPPKPKSKGPPSSLRKAILKSRKEKRMSVDSFAQIMTEGMSEVGSTGGKTSGRNIPPTVEELKKIADDIRAGRI
ncbi:hypothetical protein P154DRAFT_526593 [Amniculicola lignicola CBS 123094]|uniref:Uncharacterized protein n=1 Tax=Amniculicola lignicola CBS 123094 TaxID=1392246 RepID=A0A6A5W012_9PLEO|nr:hypothetical protein P154DRAFT_526593 [Amniculicola lignicola CBS 123094]